MKKLNEYRDEIFRRSAEKKRKIKKRRRIALGVCIPLCLCAVLTVVLIPKLPLPMKADLSMEMAPDLEVPEGILMTVQWQDLELCVNDPEIAAQWEQLLTEWPLEAGKQENGSSELADTVTPEDYVITLYTGGEPDRYRVTDRRLYREATGQSRDLTPAELSQLEALVNP